MTWAACFSCAVVPSHSALQLEQSLGPLLTCLQGFADYGLEEPSVEGMDMAPVPRIDWSAKTKEEIVRGVGWRL